MSYPNLASLTTTAVQQELEGSKTAIDARITSQQCLTFAYPYGELNSSIISIANNIYLASKGVTCQLNSAPFDFSNVRTCSRDNGDDIYAMADSAEQEGKWLMTRFHSLDEGRDCWGGMVEPYDINMFTTYLDYLTTKNLYVGTFGSVVKYIRERTSATLRVVSNSSDQIVLSLTDTLPDAIYDQPLTIRSEVPSTWITATVQQGSSTTKVNSTGEGTTTVIYYHAVPDRGYITLRNPQTGSPQITALVPSSITAGSSGFVLQVSGDNFVPGSVVRWNGANRATTFVSITQLTAAILSADLATPGTMKVTVFNPDGSVSNAMAFEIRASQPAVIGLFPSWQIAGGPTFTLTVDGSNFVSGVKVQWNGSDRATSFVSSTEVRASIPAADIATAGTASVTAYNPPPGGGTSNAIRFDILPSLDSLSLSPSSVVGGSGSTGTVTLNGPAPSGGAVVSLSSSNGSVATVPASVTVPGGSASATFSVTTVGVSSSTAVTISPVYGVTRSASLTVNPSAVSLVSLSLSPSSVEGGSSSTGTVMLNGPAPSGGAVVSLSSSNASVASVPSTVTIESGNTSATFMITTTTVSKRNDVKVNISAKYGGVIVKDSLLILRSTAPAVTTLAATSVGANTATLNGNVTANGLATGAWFEYGTDPSLSSPFSTPTQSVGSGTTSQSVSAPLTGLSAGTTYYYRVAASNSSGTTRGSILSFTPGVAPAVTTLAATSVGANTATLNGNVTANGLATGAWFEYGTDPSLSSPFSTPTQSVGSGTTSQSVSAPLTGLSAGTTYYYRVAASNSSGTTRGSILSFITALSLPVAPTGVTATAGDGQVTISWSAVTGATSYNIYYSMTAGVTKATGTKLANRTSPSIVSGLNGTTYYFVVTAVNVAGESVESSQVSATPTPAPAPPPSAPTGVTATAGAGKATISWSAVTGAASYNIYYSTTAGVTRATGTKLTNRTSPSIVSGLTSGTAYYFVVTAVNAGGESTESSQVSATPFVEYVAFGSSTTFGVGDDYPLDDTSLDGRNTGGGFEPILNNLLTSAKGIPHSIVNEGYPGYKTTDALVVLPTVLANHPDATYYLILYGSNDAAVNLPSGLGLNPGDPGYNGSYKDNMQRMISAIKTAGKIPYLAKLAYTLDAVRNVNIPIYNQVIDELVVSNGISVTPPDFWSWFQAHQDQLADTLHPNGVGYQSMASLWLNALVLSAPGAIASDDFNRTNETPISGNWTKAPATSENTGTINLSGSQIIGGSFNTDGVYYYNASKFSNNQYSKIKVTKLDGNKVRGPAVRVNTGGSLLNSYIAIIGTSALSISKFVNDVYTANISGSASYTVSANDVITLVAIGNVITLYVNGIERASAVDNSIPSGSPGICTYSNVATYDDWEGGDAANR